MFTSRLRCAHIAAALLLLALAGCARRDDDAIRPPVREPSAFARSTGALMAPGARHGFLVLDDGTLTNGLWQVRFWTQDRTPALGEGAVAYEDRWLPIARWSWRDGGVEWSCEAVPFAARGDGDSLLAVSLELSAAGPAGQVEARVTLDSMPASPAFLVAAGVAPAAGELRWASRKGRAPACAWSGQQAAGKDLALRGELVAGRRRVWRLLFASEVTTGDVLARLSARPHARLRDEARAAWRAQMQRGVRLGLGDSEVERAFHASVATLLCCRERIAGRWFPTGGPFQYHDVWLRDGCRAIAALSRAGYTAETRAMAEGFLSLQLPQGAFITQRGQLDGTGQALWAFEQALLRGPPDTSVARYAHAAVRGVQWVEAQRELGTNLGTPFARMLPFADPRDNELVRAQLVGNDLWSLRGYEAAARLQAAAGDAEGAARTREQRERYAAEVRAALVRCGSADVPPSWQRLGRDWGNLTIAWPCGVLAPNDPRCERLAARAWALAGGPGPLAYGERDSLHGYLGADLGMWAMLAGHPAEAESVFAGLLRWRDATGAGAELFSRSTRDFGRNFPPHPTSAAAIVQHVLTALVFDDGDELLLTSGARPEWWRGSEVHSLPTRWGRMDLSFSLERGVAQWRWTALPVATRLRLPPGTRPAGGAARAKGAAGAAGAAGDVRAVGEGFELRVPAGRTEASLNVEAIPTNR